MIKRIFDLLLSLFGLILVAPVLVVIGYLIRREDGGPIFYRGERAGRFGTPFRMFKFRTMVVNADRIGGPSTADDDPRITRIGRQLRKMKLDELPQLFNVLKGEMSIVGPRPEVQAYTSLYTGAEKAILSVRPGISDWASIWNADEGAILAGAEDPEQAYLERIRPTKLKLQLKYVQEQSLRTDLAIVVQTLRAVIARPAPPMAEPAEGRL
jgi:lipopolysaccharide/colanic/teichoic acid biosynthesis glycosyltransferase